MRTYHLFQKITFIVSLLVSLSLLASAQKSLVTGKVITAKDGQPLLSGRYLMYPENFLFKRKLGILLFSRLSDFKPA